MIERERKFLVRDGSYKGLAHAVSHIRQGYICAEHGRTVRVRLRDDHAILTIKGPSMDGGFSRYEFETEVSISDGEALLALCVTGIIDKHRWLVRHGCHIIEVDEFHGYNDGLTIAEIEYHDGEVVTDDEGGASLPAFLGAEVTGDERYYNSFIALHPYATWR